MEWIRSARRSLELRVLPDGKVQVRSPWHTTRQEMEAFVQSKARWLNKALSNVNTRMPPPSRKRFEPDALHCLLGKTFPLKFSDATRSRARFEKDGWSIEMPQDQWYDKEKVEKLLGLWYRQAAKPIFERLIDQHFPFFEDMGFERPTLSIRQMKSRWGSMSSQGALSLNTELMKYPLPLIEYVVVHELCHMKYMNHGARFKSLQGKLLPDWEHRRQQLNAGLEIYFAESGSPEN